MEYSNLKASIITTLIENVSCIEELLGALSAAKQITTLVYHKECNKSGENPDTLIQGLFELTGESQNKLFHDISIVHLN